MSEQHQLEALKKIIEEQKVAISQISHEIRNPVTLINSSLHLIQKQHPEVRDFPFWNNTMQDLAYLLRLLDEVSHYNNGMTLHPEFLDTSQWLTEITSVYHHAVSAPFRFSSHIPQNLPCLHADPVKLRQAVSNLIRNGFESLKEEGEVTLDASADEQHLILCITDTGCGIPQEYIDTLFLPFVTHKSVLIRPPAKGLLLPSCSLLADTIFPVRPSIQKRRQKQSGKKASHMGGIIHAG